MPNYFVHSCHFISLETRNFSVSIFLANSWFCILCNFQAFDITSSVHESLDDLLADSLNKRMPQSGLQVFGISQIAQEDTTGSKRFYSQQTVLGYDNIYIRYKCILSGNSLLPPLLNQVNKTYI